MILCTLHALHVLPCMQSVILCLVALHMYTSLKICNLHYLYIGCNSNSSIPCVHIIGDHCLITGAPSHLSHTRPPAIPTHPAGHTSLQPQL